MKFNVGDIIQLVDPRIVNPKKGLNYLTTGIICNIDEKYKLAFICFVTYPVNQLIPILLVPMLYPDGYLRYPVIHFKEQKELCYSKKEELNKEFEINLMKKRNELINLVDSD